MITFSPRLIDLIRQPVVEPFYTIQVGQLRATSYRTPITLSNGEFFEINDIILGLDAPQLTSSVDRELYKITLADPGFDLGYSFDSNIVGQTVVVRAGFIDQETGLPETNTANMILVYKGLVESPAYRVNTEESGESIAVITCSSHMGDLDMTRAFYTSKDWIKSIAPNDTCFDQVYAGSGTVNLKWGKK